MRITIKNKQKIIPLKTKEILRAAWLALPDNARKLNQELCLVFVDDRQIRVLNKNFLKDTRATDCLTFDLREKNSQLLADIVISAETALRNSRIFKNCPNRELALLVIHGVLHLFGYDDNSVRNALIMRRRQNILLNKLMDKE